MLIILCLLLATVIYYKLKKNSKYWQERDVVHEKPLLLFGNMASVLFRKKHTVQLNSELYNKFPNQRYIGMFQFCRPVLMLKDVDLIKRLTVTEFDNFHDRSITKIKSDPLLSRSLVTLTGSEWKEMRSTLSPIFTSSKMRSFYQLMSESAESFVGFFRRKEQVAVEMKDVFSRFATDVIATTAFGIRVDSLNEPKNTFFTLGTSLNSGVCQFFKRLLFAAFPSVADCFGVRIFPREHADFFQNLVKDSIKRRERNGVVRMDLIHLLMEARKGNLQEEMDSLAKPVKLTDDDIVAQAMLFFFAGFDTASTTSCFMAYELATHPEIQEKLQKEIDQVTAIYQHKVPYDVILSMKYLDQVISETLRMWTPGYQIDRRCTKNFTIESTKFERELFLEKGSVVMIPIAAIHRDPKFWHEPAMFDPGRFSDENKSKILPGTYLPFGIGPRNCIGSRFALLEMKTLFFHLLKKFDIVPIEGTQIPIEISTKKINLFAEKGFRLGFRPRKGTN